jgi:menaquinone-dependent protoporphyrinogen oxidase
MASHLVAGELGSPVSALGPRDYRVFAGVIEREYWPLASRLLYHALGGRLGDRRDWREIEAWAQTIAAALRTPTAR